MMINYHSYENNLVSITRSVMRDNHLYWPLYIFTADPNYACVFLIGEI